MSRRSSASSLTMLRVVRRVRRRGRRGLDRSSVGRAAERVEQVGAPQLLGDGDRVDRLALAVERLDGVVDVAVRGLVEVADVDARLDRGGDRVAREQHRAEQRLLGLEVVRRDPRRAAPRRRSSSIDWTTPPLRRSPCTRRAPAVGMRRVTRPVGR